MDQEKRLPLWQAILRSKRWRWNMTAAEYNQRANAQARWAGPIMVGLSPILLYFALGFPETIQGRIFLWGVFLLWQVIGFALWRSGRNP